MDNNNAVSHIHISRSSSRVGRLPGASIAADASTTAEPAKAARSAIVTVRHRKIRTNMDKNSGLQSEIPMHEIFPLHNKRGCFSSSHRSLNRNSLSCEAPPFFSSLCGTLTLCSLQSCCEWRIIYSQHARSITAKTVRALFPAIL